GARPRRAPRQGGRRRGRGDRRPRRRRRAAAGRAPELRLRRRGGARRVSERSRPAGRGRDPRRPPPSRLPHADRRGGRRSRCRSRRMPLTVGTAGHIDHGKTWLVRALTGVDTDRLPEEQERGISIALGYAPLELPDGRSLSLIDVPGHERFVRTMVAGATGIDLFLLVIDAAEGARPQTHEHLAILRLLGVDVGVVAVTKSDTVDAETLELAVAEAHDLVPGADVVAVSARTGPGRGVAAGLPGVERRQLRRGDALVEAGSYPVSYRLDVSLEELTPIDDGARVHIHHGTSECVARIVRAGGPYAQLRLAAP